jgi:hypothetical protein
LSQEDYTLGIFSPAPMGVSIIDIKVCTFSIDVNSFMISSIDSWLFFVLGHIFFSTQILSIETEWNFPSILRIMASMWIGQQSPVLNISFVIY